MGKIQDMLSNPLPSADDVPLGGVIPSNGNAVTYKTGSWRTQRPIFVAENCTNCLICWLHCPDNSILLEDGKVVGIDADHCKGCGICDVECPTKPEKRALSMAQGGFYKPDETFAKSTL
ncbi:MAG: ferredoxin [Chloroflexota bacterium]|jgi:pyruvate ferredoxin oxidoreductase delta subunit